MTIFTCMILLRDYVTKKSVGPLQIVWPFLLFENFNLKFKLIQIWLAFNRFSIGSDCYWSNVESIWSGFVVAFDKIMTMMNIYQVLFKYYCLSLCTKMFTKLSSPMRFWDFLFIYVLRYDAINQCFYVFFFA